MKKGDAFTSYTARFRESLGYDAHGNITSVTRKGKKSSSTYGTMDNLTLSYDGNRLASVSETVADYDFAGSFEYKKANGSQYIYDANGSLVADKSRGIAYITYDANNNPATIYFTNGNVTKYSYSATGRKMRVEYYVAAPNTSVTFGVEPDALTQGQTMYAGSTDYLLGGSLVRKDGVTDKYLFEGGYAKASVVNPTTYRFNFLYYNQDHLGNNREVVDSAGTVKQVTNYYPFGAPYADPAAVLNASLQPYKYNGKELDRMHGLDTYDYGARLYNPILGRWDRVDPLCEKYYAISPYAYCHNNPVIMVDPNGKHDYKLTQSGYIQRIRRTKSSFHTIFATNSNGTINKQTSINVSKSFLNSHHRAIYKGRASDNHGGAISKYTMDSYNTTDVNEGKQFFKFAVDNTQVEWSYIEIQNTEESQAFVTTSHSEGDEIGLSVIVDKVDASNESISEATHSHSYGNDRLSQGDINLADKVHKKSPSAKLFIYDRIRYNFYNEESQYDTLPELIVKPEPKPEPEP